MEAVPSTLQQTGLIGLSAIGLGAAKAAFSQSPCAVGLELEARWASCGIASTLKLGADYKEPELLLPKIPVRCSWSCPLKNTAGAVLSFAAAGRSLKGGNQGLSSACIPASETWKALPGLEMLSLRERK